MSNLSPELETELRARHRNYFPNYEVCGKIGGVVLITVSGPSGVGKNSVMRATGLNTVYGFTARPQRQEEKNQPGYTFLADDIHTYLRISEEVRSGNLVQYGVGMENYLYGSYPDEYIPNDGSEMSILDNSSTGAIRMRPLPFKSILNTYLTAPYEQWLGRFEQSRSIRMNNNNRTKIRISEAYESLSIALEDGEFTFIENLDGKLAAASQKILALTSGHDISVEQARRQAAKLRRDIKDNLL